MATARDIRNACRGLWRARSFTASAVLMLALGIGATTLMFALTSGVLLRPLPVHEPDRLIVAWKELGTAGPTQYPFGDTEIESVALASQLLEKTAGVSRHGVTRSVVTENGVSSYANVALVTGGFFDVLGVQPVLGRTLAPLDDRRGAENAIVISAGLWHRRYGGSRDVVGRRVFLAEEPFTIVGVMPSDLDFPTGVEVWRTTSSIPLSDPFAGAARREVNLVGRLRPAVTPEQARSELIGLTRRLESEAPAGALRDLVPVVQPFSTHVVGNVRTPLFALFGAVGLLLLIAVANVANLLLLRGEARRGEFAVRAALGAAPARLVREVLTESLVLAVAGGLGGLAVAWGGLAAVTRLVPDGLPRVESITLDATVVAFSVALAFVTAVASGLAPAVVVIRADLVSRLRPETRAVTRSAATGGRRVLVVAQVALAIMIVAAAGLLVRSVVRLGSVDLGFAPNGLVLLDLHVPQATYGEAARHTQFLDAAIAQLAAVPGIASVTPVNVAPFSGQGWDLPRFVGEGQSAEQAAANPSLNLESIHPDYFETFQVPIVRGRGFTAADREGATAVAVISEDLAARTWPGQDAIGKRLKMGDFDSPHPWAYTVVGVARQTRYRLVSGPHPTLYLPAAQFQVTATMLVLRSSASLELVSSVSREILHSIDPDVHIMRLATFGELLARPLARPRFNAYVLAIFASAALLLSMVGLYAVMAAYVRQRDREIALRLALGATAGGVRRFVLAEAVRLTGLGVVIGGVGAIVAARMVRGLLFEVGPYDPLTLGAALSLLIVCSALACYLPVRRATSVDAVAMLRG